MRTAFLSTRLRRGSQALAVSALTALTVLAGFTSPAVADVDLATCDNYVSAQTCWLGAGYRGYIEINSGTWAGTSPRSEWCAKAQSAAGNIKSGSGCNLNAVNRRSCLDNVSPNSTGYAYWAGSGSALQIFVEGRTPSSSTYC
jgi:hypothetical protein